MGGGEALLEMLVSQHLAQIRPRRAVGSGSRPLRLTTQTPPLHLQDPPSDQQSQGLINMDPVASKTDTVTG